MLQIFPRGNDIDSDVINVAQLFPSTQRLLNTLLW